MVSARPSVRLHRDQTYKSVSSLREPLLWPLGGWKESKVNITRQRLRESQRLKRSLNTPVLRFYMFWPIKNRQTCLSVSQCFTMFLPLKPYGKAIEKTPTNAALTCLERVHRRRSSEQNPEPPRTAWPKIRSQNKKLVSNKLLENQLYNDSQTPKIMVKKRIHSLVYVGKPMR